MLRRLLLVLLGLGGAAVAAALWSGTAYASTPHPLAAPTIPGALGTAPSPTGGLTLPLPPLAPRPPAQTLPVPPVVPRVVAALPPVVSRTVTRVVGAVPPVVTPRAPRLTHSASVAPAALVLAPVVTREAAPSAHTAFTSHPAVGTAVVMSAAASAHSPSARGFGPLFAGVADNTDTTGSTPRPGPGAPFAVTARRPVIAARGSTRVTLVDVREPAVVVLRDIARPG